MQPIFQEIIDDDKKRIKIYGGVIILPLKYLYNLIVRRIFIIEGARLAFIKSQGIMFKMKTIIILYTNAFLY